MYYLYPSVKQYPRRYLTTPSKQMSPLAIWGNTIFGPEFIYVYFYTYWERNVSPLCEAERKPRDN
jgi:hypothetical protein